MASLVLRWYLEKVERAMGRLSQLFFDFDADANGMIDRAEFSRLLEHCGRSVSPEETERLWNLSNSLEDEDDNAIVFADAFGMACHQATKACSAAAQ